MKDDEIHQQLDWTIKMINKRISVDYKLAVPQYFNEKFQLLLPLSTTPEAQKKQKPELALVVEEHKTDYSTTTCLTIDMAYNNAQLIAKPHSNWLKLQHF